MLGKKLFSSNNLGFTLAMLALVFTVGYLFGSLTILESLNENDNKYSLKSATSTFSREIISSFTSSSLSPSSSSSIETSEKNKFKREKCLSNPLLKDNIISSSMYEKVENSSDYWYQNLPTLYQESLNNAMWNSMNRKEKSLVESDQLPYKFDKNKFNGKTYEPSSWDRFELFLPITHEKICPLIKYGGHPMGKGEDGQKYLCQLPSIASGDSTESPSSTLSSSASSSTKLPLLTLEAIKKENDNYEYCTIFSIGSNGDWNFEEDILRKTKCVIETFDCTVTGNKAKIPSNLENTNRVRLHRLCLGNPYSSVKGSQFQYRDLRYLVKYTNHSSIDVLKVDIEGYEYSFFHDLLGIQEKPELSHLSAERKQQATQPPQSHYKIENSTVGKVSEKVEDKVDPVDALDAKLMKEWLSSLSSPSHDSSSNPFPKLLPNQISFEMHYHTQFKTEPWWFREYTAGEMVLLAERLYQEGYRSVASYNNLLCKHCKEFTLVKFNC